MRAVADVVAGKDLLHQRQLFLFVGAAGAFDRRLAGDGVQQIVAQALRCQVPSGQQLARQRGQACGGLGGVKLRRDLAQRQTAAAEVREFIAEFRQKRRVFQQDRGLLALRCADDGL